MPHRNCVKLIKKELQKVEMKYTLGEIADMLGLTKNSIRNYEKQGLLHVIREDTNNYRVFSDQNVYQLCVIRSFRGMGFSLEQIKELTNKADYFSMIHLAQEHKNEVMEQINELFDKMAKLDYFERNLLDIIDSGDTYSITTVEDYYFLSDDVIKKEDKESVYLHRCWINNMPHVAISLHGYCSDEDINLKWGYSILKKDAIKKRLPLNSEVCSISSSRAVYSLTKANDPGADWYISHIAGMQEYARQHGYASKNEIFLKGKITLNLNNPEKEYYSGLYLLIE